MRTLLVLVLGLTLILSGVVYGPLVLLLGIGLLVLGGFFVLFFRDPERRCAHDSGVLLSAADGTVVEAEHGRVAVFMSLWDVHICRSPCDAKVVHMHTSGDSHLPAFLSRSRHNARLSLKMSTAHGDVEVVLISGILARRIDPFVGEGESVKQGQRIARIVLGSRVEVHFDEPWRVCVARGETVRAGITPIARLDGNETKSEG